MRALLLVLTLGLTAPVLAQHANLRVLDPQQWGSEQGTIEAALVSVQPRGIYAEVGLYLTFSARGSTSFAASRQLEIEYHFSLPEEAVVTDSWLWVGDLIVRADIRDRQAAQEEYEDIVDRQRDPSILYKNGPTQYELRVYPMLPGETRRVKLTYLLPVDWAAGRVAVPLPLHLVRASRFPVDATRVLTYPTAPWASPRFNAEFDATLTERDDEMLGRVAEARLPWNLTQQPATLAFDGPAGPAYVGTTAELTDGVGDGWYQLALLPRETLGTTDLDGLVVLLDHHAATTSVEAEAIVAASQAYLDAHLAAGDRFMLLASTPQGVRRAADGWLTAGPGVVAEAFDALGPLATHSTLTALLAEGLAFAGDHPDASRLLVLSSADEQGSPATANQLLDDLNRLMPHPLRFFVADLADETTRTHIVDGQSYPGNTYFYEQLAARTQGATARLAGHGLPTLLSTLFSDDGALDRFDLHTTLDGDGFCYDRFTVRTPSAGGEAVLQVGRCVGRAPFEFEASGFLDGAPVSRTLRLDVNELVLTDTTLAAFWAGQQLRVWEQQAWTAGLTEQMVALSLDYRVLSRQTAFLALEPNMGGEVCTTCEDEAAATHVDEAPEARDVRLSVYPNPFHEEVTVRLVLPQPVRPEAVQATVYDLTGRRVATLAASGDGTTLTFTWDGTDAGGRRVAAGIYVLVIQTPYGRQSVRLIKL